MNLMAFSLPASSNSKVDGNQISFGTIDFQPHPTTLTPVFASLDQEMDLTIGSLSFRVGSLGSILKEICPRGNNNIVIIIFLVHDNVYTPCYNCIKWKH
jgi:hypothetical protein